MSVIRKNSNSKKFEKESRWWEDFVSENYPNEQCLKHFKCSKKTYLFLIKFLRPYVTPKIGASTDLNIYLRKGVCVEKQTAVLLTKLTTSVDYVTISKKFKIHKTTIHKIIYKCASVLNKRLLHEAIHMPKEEEADSIAKDFECVYKLPQIIGAMSIVHIPISSPINLNYQFLNSRLYPSFILQSVIDSNCFFRDVSVRQAGAAEFNTILADSNIYKYSNKVIPSAKRNINGTNVSYKIVGPSNGPLYAWLLNEYSGVLTSSESLFNKNLRKIRDYSDSVMLRLRSRFLILSQMMGLSYKVAPQIIAACCIIHNICEKNKDPIMDEWQRECLEVLKKYPQPQMDGEWEEPSSELRDERNALKDYVNNEDILVEPPYEILEAALTEAMIGNVEAVVRFY